MSGAALLVGIDHYPTGNSLTGCVADAERLADLLTRDGRGNANFACETLLGTKAKPNAVTRATVRSRLTYLLKRSVPHAVFFFSGHATLRQSSGLLVTQDAEKWEEGISMAEVVEMANFCKIPEVTIIVDSCYTGHLGESHFGGEPLVRLRDGVSLLGATSGDDEAQSGHHGSLFTSILCDGLEGAAADVRGRVTVASLYSHVDSLLGPLAQRPILRASVDRLSTIRQCKALVDDDDLRKINKYFPKPDFEFPLDPEYDTPHPLPPNYKRNDKKFEIMAWLRTLLKAGLVEPKGVPYLWTAAMEKQSCVLTSRGRFYWNMVNTKRI